ncbi:MAG: GNAT family N-acetyltransferase [Pirellulales bacterium]
MHEDYQRALRSSGAIELVVVEADGRPISVDYLIRGEGGPFAYQSGIDPERLDDKPGHLGLIGIVRDACERGDRFVDLLRGDEPYKSYWNARPQALNTWRIVPNRALPRMRSRVRHAGAVLKRWVKTNLRDPFTTERAFR